MLNIMLWLIVIAAVLLLVFGYLKITKYLEYWDSKGIPSVKPWPFLGNMAPIAFRTQAFAQLLQDYYVKFPKERYFGFYQFSMPCLMIRDPDLLKQICIKDFDTFTDHQEFLPKSCDPFWNKNLFSMTGNEWHAMRSVLSPAFTSSKMKAMFCLMAECGQNFVNHFQAQGGTITLEMKDTFMRFTNDVIASTAFGIKCNALEEKDNEFFKLGKAAFNFEGLRSLKFFGYSISPTLMKLLNVKLFDNYTRDFFVTIVRHTIKMREENGIVRPDMIHLLREAQKGRLQYEDETGVVDSGFAVVQEANLGKSKSRNKPEITEEDIAAQAMVFFFGGFDTVSILMSHLAYELAVNPEPQKKLIEEVDRTLEKCNGKITYDALLNMKYLDMVVSETLRMWSPAIFINRKAVKPFTIEAQRAGEKTFHMEPGFTCLIPIFAIHRDPKYYPNPDKFDPERFSDENKGKIPSSVYMPFGAGPRSCIASRFALLEAKTVIFYLLTQFEFVAVEKTQIPFVLSKKNINIINEEGYWMALKPRKEFN